MKTFNKLLFYYGLGIALALLCIGFIHFYSYLAEPCFSYAELDNILLTTVISGLPFGVEIWAFTIFFRKK
jgi:hypothetical protein